MCENMLTAEVEDEVMEKIVNIRPKAMDHLQELRRSQGSEGDIFLRMGVRSGGCSGLSYIMDLVKKVGQNCMLRHGAACPALCTACGPLVETCVCSHQNID